MTYHFPGYRYAYGSTRGYPAKKAEGPFTWITYSEPDENNRSVREQGFTATLEEAQWNAEHGPQGP